MIDELKREIAYRANRMGLQFVDSDIHSLEQDGYTIVFLSRHNPHLATDENGVTLYSKDGNPVIEYHYPLWVDVLDKSNDPGWYYQNALNPIVVHSTYIDVRMRNDSLVIIYDPNDSLIWHIECKRRLLQNLIEKMYREQTENICFEIKKRLP